MKAERSHLSQQVVGWSLTEQVTCQHKEALTDQGEKSSRAKHDVKSGCHVNISSDKNDKITLPVLVPMG